MFSTINSMLRRSSFPGRFYIFDRNRYPRTAYADNGGVCISLLCPVLNKFRNTHSANLLVCYSYTNRSVLSHIPPPLDPRFVPAAVMYRTVWQGHLLMHSQQHASMWRPRYFRLEDNFLTYYVNKSLVGTPNNEVFSPFILHCNDVFDTAPP